MDTFKQLAALALVAWVVAIGLGVMLRGRPGGVAVLLWPIQTAFRLIRRGLGGLLISLGQWIRGR